ncbi:antitoxin Xre/MbcA/ParS toxin-binding domain-containing protein [Mesorhizobium amorphae]|uniref:antitoxin Xre/MbcA/ParS-like domain-containing protein n=1 Tax=Mesorhizobium amorphae TaxID=71433 RepID=UPI001782A181|nr:antitoxin Xre/MbcA/ParS toxin-binding domain-containing protein [Mesorhizobium amorphae]
MTKSFGNEPRQDELSSSVAKQVQRVLAQYDEVIKAHTSTPAHMSAGNNAGTEPLSLTRQKAVHDELVELASDFVDRLVAEAARHFNASVREVAPLGVRTEDAHECAVLKARDQHTDCLRIEDWAGEVAGPTYLEKHFGIPRSTLHWWQRHNDVVALRKGARKHVFPLAQFVDGRPAPGIRQVLSLIANPRPAWLWLTSPSPRLDGRIPIQMLRQDLAAEVIWAARDFSST